MNQDGLEWVNSNQMTKRQLVLAGIPLKKWSRHHSQQKSLRCSTSMQVYAPTSNAEEAEVEQFYEDLQDFLELTPKKDVLSL